ncbi:MAG: hypothetical protein J1E07_09310 [Treponema sp.]|nr:hypothetical protein [Treponema sp.]
MDCLQKPEFWVSIATLALTFIALIVAVYIPTRIMKYQQYTNLIGAYMSFEFAHAFQSVIDFFYDDCGCDVERIPEAYRTRFDHDLDPANNVALADRLHYQRRYLTCFFFELEICRRSNRTLNRIIRKDWTKSEAFVMRILICMNDAVDNDKKIFKDISSIKRERIPRTKGISEYLRSLQEILQNESRWMQPR